MPSFLLYIYTNMRIYYQQGFLNEKIYYIREKINKSFTFFFFYIYSDDDISIAILI